MGGGWGGSSGANTSEAVSAGRCSAMAGITAEEAAEPSFSEDVE